MDSSIFGFLIVGFVLLLGIGGLGFYLLYRRSNYKHNFRVWSRDLSSSQVVRAKIEVDKENKSNRVFVFRDNPSILILRDPQHWSKGKPERWVIPDESGEFQYLSPCSKVLLSKEVVDKTTNKSVVKAIDDARYMQTRLHPIDKQLALEAMRNNQKRYELTDKAGIITFMSLIVLSAIIMIGGIYIFTVATKNIVALGDSATDLKATATINGANTILIVEGMSEVTSNLGYVIGQLKGDTTLYRPIGSS